MTTTTLKLLFGQLCADRRSGVERLPRFCRQPQLHSSNSLTFDGMRFLTFSDESLNGYGRSGMAQPCARTGQSRADVGSTLRP